MKLRSSKGCSLKIGAYPRFSYDARGGGGQAFLTETNEKNTKYIRFSPKEFKIPSLNSKTTKFLTLPLTPGLVIHISMNKLEGKINQETGEIALNFEAKFTLEVCSIYKLPELIIKSLLNTGTVRMHNKKLEGLPLQENGTTTLVGVGRIEKTNSFLLNKLLFLPAEAFAVLKCELV